MKQIPSIQSIAIKELLTVTSFLWILGVGFLYIALTVFLLNYRLVIDTAIGNFPFFDKIAIIISLLGGIFTAFSPLDGWLTLIGALLVGINLLLMGKAIYTLEHMGKLKVSVGGAAIVGLVATGCSSCGFSVLSILGLGASLSFLPFHGLSLHIIAIGFLLFSSWYMVKKLRDGLYCKR